MDPDFIKAWFATYIVGVSLIRMLDESEYIHVTAKKMIWGRTRGLLFHFLVDIVAPVLFALVYFCRAVLSFST